MSGEGDKGQKGTIPGDLYIVMFVLPHKYFERHGNHLVCQIPITYPQAVLGTDIKVKTLDDKTVKIKIPSGTKHGEQLRIKGEGVKPVNSYGKGDMIIVVDIEIPSSLSSKEKDVLKEFAKLHKDNSEPEPINLEKKRRY
jgi:molecular chaperone DnaJ